MITRYQKRIFSPLMDHIDLHVDVPRVEYEKLTAKTRAESSAVLRERVEAVRLRQAQMNLNTSSSVLATTST